MNEIALIPLVFFVVPGFVADGVYRASRGAESESSDLRTLLRSLVWSAVGLAVPLAVAPESAPMRRLTGILESGPGNFFDASLLGALLIHAAASSALALAFGYFSGSDRIFRAFTRVFRRSPDLGGAWAVAMRHGRAERFVRVTTRSGRAYWGRLLSAGLSAQRDIAIADPSRDTVEGDGSALTPITAARIIYIAESEIAEVWLSPTKEEVDDAVR